MRRSGIFLRLGNDWGIAMETQFLWETGAGVRSIRLMRALD